MAVRKQTAKAPAFVVTQADKTDFPGLTQVQVFAALIAQGIFAGPAGREILDAKEPEEHVFRHVRDVSFRMARVMAEVQS